MITNRSGIIVSLNIVRKGAKAEAFKADQAALTRLKKLTASAAAKLIPTAKRPVTEFCMK